MSVRTPSRAVVALVALLALPAAAHATPGAPPTGYVDRAGLVTDGSGHTAGEHVAVVFPEGSGQKYVRVTPNDNGASSTWVISLTGGDMALPTTIDAPCTDTSGPGAVEITCTVTTGQLHNGVEVWTGNDADTIEYESTDPDDASPVYTYLRDGGPTDGMLQFFIGGPSNDHVDVAVGSDPSHGSTNWFIAGGGTDTYVPSPHEVDIDIVSYEDHDATQPVDVTMDGVANDGYPGFDGLENVPTRAQGLNAVFGGAGDDVIVGDAGSTFLDGLSGEDVLDGGAATDQLFGGSGDDVLTGGAGNDWFYGDRTWEQVGYGQPSSGPDGGDQFFLRDGEADKLFECGGGIDHATMDLVEVDPDLAPTSEDCEHRDRAALDGGTGGGGGGTTDGGGGGTPTTDTTLFDAIPGTFVPQLTPTGTVSTKRTLRMPRFVKLRKTVAEAERSLNAAKVNVDYTYVGVPASRFPRSERARLRPGQLLSTSPAAGRKLTTGFPAPSAKATLTYYDIKLPRDAACPYTGRLKVGRGTVNVFDELKLMSLREASDKLDDYGCNWRIKSTIHNRTVTDTQMWNFRATGRGKRRVLNVVLASPMQPDFRAIFSQPLQQGYEKELGLVADSRLGDGETMTNGGSVPAADQTRYFGITVVERATARLVPYLTVVLLDGTGTEIARGRTNENGALLMQFATKQKSGVLRLVMEHTDAKGNVLMSAVQELKVVDLGAKPWADLNGNVMNKQSSRKFQRYHRTGEVVTSKGRRAHGKLVAGQRELVELTAKMYEDIAVMMEQSSPMLSMAIGLPFRAMAAELRAQVATMTAEEAARKTGMSIALMGNSRTPLATFGDPARGLLSGSVRLIGADGASMQTFTGAGIVAAGAGNIVAAGGGNIVAAGAGNIVAAGGGNIVAAGGGNIVAAGGGNIVAAGAGNIVAAGAGNFTGRSHARTGLVPRVVAADYTGRFASTGFVADPRSMEIRTIGDTTVIANPNGTLPYGTKVALGQGETPIAIPGKLQ